MADEKKQKSTKNRSPRSIGIDSQDERREIRRMKIQLKLMYSCLTVTTTTTKSTWQKIMSIYLDSCASKRLFILCDQSCLESFVYSGGSIQTIRAGVQLNCLGTGKFRDWLDIRVCNDAVKNICSAGLLRDMGYGLQLLHVPGLWKLILIVVCRM